MNITINPAVPGDIALIQKLLPILSGVPIETSVPGVAATATAPPVAPPTDPLAATTPPPAAAPADPMAGMGGPAPTPAADPMAGATPPAADAGAAGAITSNHAIDLVQRIGNADRNKFNDIRNLLSKYGAPKVTELDAQHLPGFYTDLRAIAATIPGFIV